MTHDQKTVAAMAPVMNPMMNILTSYFLPGSLITLSIEPKEPA